MGITVTTNLELIKPDDDEKIQEDLPTFAGWAAQNEINCDKIDALFRATTHTYTPAWTATAVNPTLGAGGYVEGKYIRVLPRMVIGQFRVFCGGAGFAAGTGTYNFTLPTSVATEFSTFNLNVVPLGKMIVLDTSTILPSTVMGIIYGGTDLMFMRNSDAVLFSSTGYALAQNDRMSGYFMYPTSDA